MNMAETAAKYHHLIPQTYMSAWANNSGTLKVEFINEPGIIVERNKEHIAGITDYHSIRAGMPICTATDAASIFNALLESSGSFQILNLNLSPIHSCVHRLTKVSSESVTTLLIRSSG